jgi:hypothetical protein
MNGKIKWVLWAIFGALLLVLLPHTAWAFGQFEPEGWIGKLVGWVGAIAFEGAIGTLTWRLKQRIEEVPNSSKRWVRFKRRYLNIYGAGLLVATGVSSLANWSHAVEFGSKFVASTDYGISSIIYTLAFGGILPVCSLFFAHILADTTEAEQQEDTALIEAKNTIKELKRELRIVETERQAAEQRFTAIGDLFVQLTQAERKRDRILAARQLWPALPPGGVAVVAGVSRSYVSEVLPSEVTE